jgi:hypothetical protein
LTHTGLESSQNIVGLQIISIVFLNDANPYDNNEFSDLFDLPEIKFYTDMASNINYNERKRRGISADAAEVIYSDHLKINANE